MVTQVIEIAVLGAGGEIRISLDMLVASLAPSAETDHVRT